MQIGAVTQPIAAAVGAPESTFCFAVTREALREVEEEDLRAWVPPPRWEIEDDYDWPADYEYEEQAWEAPPCNENADSIPVPSDDSDLEEVVEGPVYAQMHSCKSSKMLVDSGSIVNTCRPEFDPSTPTTASRQKLN